MVRESPCRYQTVFHFEGSNLRDITALIIEEGQHAAPDW